MMPLWIGARSFRALAIGARQFVVQEAAEMIFVPAGIVVWFVLNTIVGRSLPAGAEITTFFAPAFR